METGLATEEALGQYVGEVKALHLNWPVLGTPQARASSLVAIANHRLAAVGVVPTKPSTENLRPNVFGQLRIKDWTIALNESLVRNDQVTEGEIAQAAKTVYHEARHAEQWFRMARWVAGQESTKEQGEQAIAERMLDSISPEAAKAAAANPLRPIEADRAAQMTSGTAKEELAMTRTLLREAETWYEQIYSDRGFEERKGVLDEFKMNAGAEEFAKERHNEASVAMKAIDAERAEVNAAYTVARSGYVALLWQNFLKIATGTATPGDFFMLLSEHLKVSALRRRLDQLEARLAEAQHEVAVAYTELLLAGGPARIASRARYQALAEEADAHALAARVLAAW